MPYGWLMLIVTTEGLPGYDVRTVLGEVFGVAVRTASTAAAGGAAPSSGTFRMPTNDPAVARAPGTGLTQARQEAVGRLAAEAQRHGANAVVGMRFDNGLLAGGDHEVCAYGTAVWVEPFSEAARRQAAAVQQEAHGPQPGSAERPPMAARNLTMGLRTPGAEGHR